VPWCCFFFSPLMYLWLCHCSPLCWGMCTKCPVKLYNGPFWTQYMKSGGNASPVNLKKQKIKWISRATASLGQQKACNKVHRLNSKMCLFFPCLYKLLPFLYMIRETPRVP
jgi:hypothetical protein